MLDKLEAINQRYENVNEELMQPDVMSDLKRYKSLNKEYKELGKIVAQYRNYQQVLSNIDNAREVVATEKDQDFREMAKAELDELLPEQERLEEVIKDLLLPKDPNDSKDVIMEIRAGAGGDEAAIFAGDLQRMYMRFAEKQGWKMELMDAMDGTAGGYKEIIVAVRGEDVYGKLKFESGVHRVQRVPATETQGRIHTSVASIVVIPEVEEFDVELNMGDIRKDYVLLQRPRRPVGEHHLLGRAPHPPAHRPRGPVPGPEVAAQKLRQGPGRAPLARVRHGAGQEERGRRPRAQKHDWRRRPLRQNPHLQLPPGPRHGPPHRLHGV